MLTVNDFELDEQARVLLESILQEEEHIRAACEAIRSDIGSLIGHEIPFDHNGHVQTGVVTAVRGFGRDYGIDVRNSKTGVMRKVSTFAVFTALRRLHEKE